MAAKPATIEIQELIARSDAARNHLGRAAHAIRDRLDAPARVRESLRAHPTAWLAGATATGLLASRLLFRRRSRRPALPISASSIPLFLIRTLFNAATPALKIWLLAQAKSWLNRRVPEQKSIQTR